MYACEGGGPSPVCGTTCHNALSLVAGLSAQWPTFGLGSGQTRRASWLLAPCSRGGDDPHRHHRRVLSPWPETLGATHLAQFIAVCRGEFHSPRKVDNSFLGRASAYRHCPLWSSRYLRLWFTRLSHSVRSFPTVNRATSFPPLFRSGFRSALCRHACLAQSADDYVHTRTVPASPDPPGHGRWRAAVAKWN